MLEDITGRVGATPSSVDYYFEFSLLDSQILNLN